MFHACIYDFKKHSLTVEAPGLQTLDLSFKKSNKQNRLLKKKSRTQFRKYNK